MGPRIGFVLLVGCTFTPPGPSSSVPVDAAGSADAPSTSPACNVSTAAMAMPVAASLGESPGSSQGSSRPPLNCGPGELPIGIGFSTTTDPVDLGDDERVATAIVVQCGKISRRTDGSFSIAPGNKPSFTSQACSSPWSPVTVAPVTSCPANMVLVGLTGNRGEDSLFNTVSLTCAALTPAGEVGTTTEAVPVVDTGSYNNRPQTAACPDGRAVVGFALRSGCGIDKLTPACAPLRCN
jgi:hypothetical protein